MLLMYLSSPRRRWMNRQSVTKVSRGLVGMTDIRRPRSHLNEIRMGCGLDQHYWQAPHTSDALATNLYLSDSIIFHAFPAVQLVYFTIVKWSAAEDSQSMLTVYAVNTVTYSRRSSGPKPPSQAPRQSFVLFANICWAADLANAK